MVCSNFLEKDYPRSFVMRFRITLLVCVACVTFSYFYARRSGLPPQMNGDSSIEFKPTVHAFRNFIQSGDELGSSFTVFRHHDQVLNLVGGYADLRFKLEWTSNTITQAFTLSMLSIPITFALLYDRNLIQPEDLIVRHLPTFSAPNITISDLLTHRSGFPYFSDQIQLIAWRDDYKRMLPKVLHQVPPASLHVQKWHFHTLGILADAIVRKVDPKGRTLGHYFMEEIAWPLGLDLVVGLPRSQLYRAARTYHASWLGLVSSVLRLDFTAVRTALITSKQLFESSERTRAFGTFSDYDLLYNWNADLLEVPLASTHMFTNARSLARLLTVLYSPIDQGLPDVPSAKSSGLFTGRSLEWLLQEVDESRSSLPSDPILHRPIRLTTAGLMVERSPEGKPIVGMWDDVLGQAAFVDPYRRVTFAYMTNHAHGCSLERDSILSTLQTTTYNCL